MTDDVLWILLHIPKTGGTTFNRHVCNELGDRAISYSVGMDAQQLEKAQVVFGHQTYYGLHRQVEKDCRYVVFIRDPAKRIVSYYNHQMRPETSETALSFEEWYRHQIPNEMCHFLHRKWQGKEGARASVPRPALTMWRWCRSLLPNVMRKRIRRSATQTLADNTLAEQKLQHALAVLERCWFVGITHHLNDDLPLLFQQLGISTDWENAVGKQKLLKLDDALAERLYADNPQDLQLYKAAQKRRAETVATISQEQ